MKNNVWTMAEQYDGSLKAVSFELLSRGRILADKLGVSLCSVIIGPYLEDKTLNELIRRGADEVIAIGSERLKFFTCESYSPLLEALIRDYEPCIILAAATTTGRTLLPYTAVKIHTGLTADCTTLDIEEGTGLLLQTRPAIGGNIMATIKTPDHKPQMATVRPRSSRPPEERERQGSIYRFTLGETLPGGGILPLNPGAGKAGGEVIVKGCRREESGFANMEDADVIFAGGRGLRKGENFKLLRELAAALGGEVAASRDAVDRGWISYPHQVGLSGKTVSPRLYIGSGISGAVQHLAGIKTSEAIVSINSDPQANLHKVADLAIVADAFPVLEELKKRLLKHCGEKNG